MDCRFFFGGSGLFFSYKSPLPGCFDMANYRQLSAHVRENGASMRPDVLLWKRIVVFKQFSANYNEVLQ